jgi:hypothetical protein
VIFSLYTQENKLMPGINNYNLQEFQSRLARFNQAYVNDWNQWLNTSISERPYQFGVVLRRWQACRPNRMRRTKAEFEHDPPYLEDLIVLSAQHMQTLQDFNISQATSFTQQTRTALRELWKVFEQLSYQGNARNGLAGVVGISKAVLLLSDGRVGPAFDSQVRGHLNLKEPKNADEWIGALHVANRDINAFEVANAITLQQAAPEYAHLHCGRIYDMALGPGV